MADELYSPEQDALALEYEQAVRAAFESISNPGRFFYQRAAEVLKKLAVELGN